MPKDILRRIISFGLLTTGIGIAIYFLHYFFLEERGYTIAPFGVYVYFFIFSLVVYILMEGLNTILPNSTGLFFLACVFVKMGVFTLLYKSVIFAENPMNLTDKLVIIIPFIVFLLLEVFGLVRLLNSADQKPE